MIPEAIRQRILENMGLPGYDAWKLASPDDTERPVVYPKQVEPHDPWADGKWKLARIDSHPAEMALTAYFRDGHGGECTIKLRREEFTMELVGRIESALNYREAVA